MKTADIGVLCSLMAIGCGERIPTDSWKRTYPCSAQIMSFTDASKEQIGREKEEIVKYLENKIDPNIQKVPPIVVLELILEGGLIIECGDSIKDDTIATWNGVITLNNRYHERLVNHYFNYRSTLTEEFELDPGFIDDSPPEDFEDIFYAAHMTYFALADMAETLVHEGTHAAFELSGLSHRHPKQKDGSFEYDPFYEYGKAAKELIWIKFGEEVDKIPEK
ncbi:MAG: hypothetical protein Q8Q01_03260 [archaeon]|nr:hypothetical protein [archaeon]